jgi:hypothetical protein
MPHKDPEKRKAYSDFWNGNNIDYKRANDLWRRYNLTPSQYDTMFESQDGRCAICRKPQEHFKKRLHVEHQHSDGLIRGLTCWKCNQLMPNRKNLVELLTRVIHYLTNPPAVRSIGEHYVSKKKRWK